LTWTVEISETAKKQLKKIDKVAAKRIVHYLRERIKAQDDPKRFGKMLKGNLRDYWRYRVGSYRIICQIKDEKLVVLVLEVGDRKSVYK